MRGAAKIGTYYNERGKRKDSVPMFSKEYLLPGDPVMAYQEDKGKHVKAVIINGVMPEVLELQFSDKTIGSYSAVAAYETVEINGEEIPKVYIP